MSTMQSAPRGLCQPWPHVTCQARRDFAYRYGLGARIGLDRSRQKSLLVPTPRMDTLEDWSFRRGASLRSPIKIFFGGAPRLNDQSDRVSILAVGISS
jgi:hypothetical protein